MTLVNQTARVACSGTLTGNEIWANIWHVATIYEEDQHFTAEEMDDIEACFETFYTAMLPLWANFTTFEQVIVSQLGGPFAPPRSYSPGLVGTGGTDVLPPQDAVVLSLRSDLNTKSGRGRIFLPGFQEGITTDGTPRVNVASRDIIGNAAVDLQADLGALAGDPKVAVYSRVLDEVNPVTSFRVGTVIDTQRRRRGNIQEQYVSFS